jgi:hypothetical protein
MAFEPGRRQPCYTINGDWVGTDPGPHTQGSVDIGMAELGHNCAAGPHGTKREASAQREPLGNIPEPASVQEAVAGGDGGVDTVLAMARFRAGQATAMETAGAAAVVHRPPPPVQKLEVAKSTRARTPNTLPGALEHSGLPSTMGRQQQRP